MQNKNRLEPLWFKTIIIEVFGNLSAWNNYTLSVSTMYFTSSSLTKVIKGDCLYKRSLDYALDDREGTTGLGPSVPLVQFPLQTHRSSDISL